MKSIISMLSGLTITFVYISGILFAQPPTGPVIILNPNSPKIPPDAQVAPVYDTPTVPFPLFDRSPPASRLPAVGPMTNLPVDGGKTTPLMRGPVHEAYAEYAASATVPGIVIDKRPPSMLKEMPPPTRPIGNDVRWISGYWGWDVATTNFVWVTGIWRSAPPGQRWVPGYWTRARYGWQWVSGFWASQSLDQIAYLPAPPQASPSSPTTEPPSGNSFWIPGQWNYVDGDYQWREGYWGVASDDWVWVPDRFVWTPHGNIFRPGYWDFPLLRRGVVFCPLKVVSFDDDLLVSPEFVIDTDANWLANLFVYPDYQHYLFGDYYDQDLLASGVLPWVSYAMTNDRQDPMFGYYQYQRDAEAFLQQLVKLHEFYQANPMFRPTLTLAAQARQFSDAAHDQRAYLVHTANIGSLLHGAATNIDLPFQFRSVEANELKNARDSVAAATELAEMRRVFEQSMPDAERAIPAGQQRLIKSMRLPPSPYRVAKPPLIDNPFKGDQQSISSAIESINRNKVPEPKPTESPIRQDDPIRESILNRFRGSTLDDMTPKTVPELPDPASASLQDLINPMPTP